MALYSVLLPQFLIPPGPEALTDTTNEAKTALGDESTGVWRGRLERKGKATGLCPWDGMHFSIYLTYRLQCYPGCAEFKPPAAVVCASCRSLVSSLLPSPPGRLLTKYLLCLSCSSSSASYHVIHCAPAAVMAEGPLCRTYLPPTSPPPGPKHVPLRAS